MDVDEIKPCPFCGGVAQRVDIPADEHDPNAGGSYIACKFCLASSSIAFGDKSSLVDNWNTRADDARIRAEAPNDRDGAITWSSFEVGMLAAMMTGNLEKDTATLAMYLLDEPKEREANEPGIDDVVAYVFADGTVTLDKWDGTRQYNGNLVVLMRRAEVEHKLKEAKE